MRQTHSILKFLIFSLAFLILFNTDSSAQKVEKNIYNKLQTKLKRINSVSFKFLLKEDPKYQGSIQAKKGNKYDIQTPVRRLICNGTTIWNYNEIEKKVVLSNFETESSNIISIENIFFNIVQNFKPTETQFINYNGKESYKLKLIPSNSKITEYKSITLFIIKEDLLIYTVQSESKDGIQTWEISNLEINPKLSDGIFEFKIPEGTQIIDLR